MFLDHTSQNEWVVDHACTHHMTKDPSLFSSMEFAIENKNFVVDDFTLNIDSHGDAFYRCGQIVYVFHVPNISANMLPVSQLT